MSPSARQERIVPRFIEQELRDSFIDYSMSVIVRRALPDARDGLKPVHRRILYAMYEQGLLADRPFKKSATVVGDVLGKYHPHGDSAVYDTLVRMIQAFSLRYPLVSGQGNFGSIDGDSAAAYRYTEARLAPIALELLEEIGRDTVDFVPNFDARLREPTVLPARLPHLLLNGSDGIAVGMATKVPPHNLRELLTATRHLVRNPGCEIEDLMAHVEGPDFPTGGYIWGYGGIGDAYRTGRGLIEMRARMHLEEGSYGKSSLVVTELPYQVNKTRIIEQITKLVRGGRVDAITDLRDESDRDGIRLVIELKRDADPGKLLRILYAKTQLRSTYGVIMLALVDGRPEQLDLKRALGCFVSHRLEVIARKAAFDLARSEQRAHVVEGLLTALGDLDRVIELIRTSRTPAEAAERLCGELDLTREQAEAILAMRLARLTGLEREKLGQELDELRERIERLRELVAEDAARRDLLWAELGELIDTYGDDRRTEILDENGPFPLPSAGTAEAALVLLSHRGYVKAQPIRNGSGMAGAEALAGREGDFVRNAFVVRGGARLLAFTALGHVHALPVSDLPRGTRSSRGTRLADSIDLGAGDRVVCVVPVESFEGEEGVVIVSRHGQVKRTALADFSNVRAGGIRAAGLADEDEVLCVLLASPEDELLLASRHGQAIRFPVSDLRPMGRSARGVRGIGLGPEDEVVAALLPRRDGDLVVATRAGYGKRVPVTELRAQARAGKGTSILPGRKDVGDVVGLLEALPGDRLACVLSSGEVAVVDVDGIPTKARRGAALRIRELAARAADVAEVHPLPVAETGARPEASGAEGAAAGPVEAGGPAAGTEAEREEAGAPQGELLLD
ncbi:MAG: DNA gyrase subunit A [Gemmatimonadota bacterium]